MLEKAFFLFNHVCCTQSKENRRPTSNGPTPCGQCKETQIYRSAIAKAVNASIVLEQHTDAFTVVDSADGFGKHVTDLQDL